MALAEDFSLFGEIAPTNDYGATDFCNRKGAHAIKAKIEQYWEARGYHVDVWLHDCGFHPSIRAARYDVRSNLRNGLPRTFPSPEQI